MIPIPFTNIAVSLSGGGYRATTFHLGTLAYLNSKEFEGNTLLENVKILSTISGGTITGAMYAVQLADGNTFKDCYHRLYELLEEDNLVEEALHNLNNPSSWKNEHKSRDVINAFSEVYNSKFYKEATFKKLYDHKTSHLTDVIFGSSEFTNGIQFRFLEEHSGRFGNGYLNLPKHVAQDIRIADAVAASSCFPGGFEPMIMPNDFGNGPKSPVNKTWSDPKKDGGKGYPTTALMDGGVIDNQGIEGVKLAEERYAKPDEPFVGTYIVSDVSSEFMSPYKVPVFKYGKFKNIFTLRSINWMVFVIALIFIGLLIKFTLPFWATFISCGLIFLAAGWFILFFYLKSLFRKQVDETFESDQVPELIKDFKVILKTPIYILFYLIKFRATSVFKMVSDVFMRRIRRLQLDSLYGSPDWYYRFKSNYIYSLEKDETLPKEMKKAILAANKMPTTLWFSEKEKENGTLNDLIACGQFTMCYNLIKYAKKLQKGNYKEKVWDHIPKSKRTAILALQASMEKDWEKFKSDPYWMVKQLKKGKNSIA